MKNFNKIFIFICLLSSIVISSKAQKPKLKKLGKLLTTNEHAKNDITISGIIDSSTMTISGNKLVLNGIDRQNRDVSVKCFKSTKSPGKWFKGNRYYDMFFKGTGHYYVWTVFIYNNQPENFVVIQREKGSYKFADEFKGKIP